MKTIVLLQDWHEHHADGSLEIHRAGDTVTVTDQVAEFITESLVSVRKRHRQVAESVPGSPEWRRS